MLGVTASPSGALGTRLPVGLSTLDGQGRSVFFGGGCLALFCFLHGEHLKYWEILGPLMEKELCWQDLHGLTIKHASVIMITQASKLSCSMFCPDQCHTRPMHEAMPYACMHAYMHACMHACIIASMPH